MSHEHRVAVVGDLMIDHNIFVEPLKIAQEAPIIAHRIIREERRAGGAAAVYEMVRAMEIDACVPNLLSQDIPTTRKYRYISAGSRNPTIVARFDSDMHYDLSDDLIDAICRDIAAFQPDVIIASDYGKGVISRKMMVRLREIPGARILVDPYTSDWIKYRGADVIVPSRLAADEFLDDEDLRGFAAVITKLDAEGVRLYGAGPIESFAATARSVVDVTGAGDQFIATLACLMRPGVSLRDAVFSANVAAGMQVERMGVVPVTAKDLRIRMAQCGEMALSSADLDVDG